MESAARDDKLEEQVSNAQRARQETGQGAVLRSNQGTNIQSRNRAGPEKNTSLEQMQ